MNNIRRKQIKYLIKALERLNNDYSKEELDECKDTLEDIKNEEEEAFDNMPEGLQYSQRGMDSEAAIDSMYDAIGYLEDAYESEDTEDREVSVDMAIECLMDASL